MRLEDRFDDHLDRGRRLGEGGLSVVYAARDTETGRSVAIKQLRKYLVRNNDVAALFETEPTLLRRYAGPGVPRVLARGTWGGLPAFVLERKGRSVACELLERFVPAERAVQICIRVCEVLLRLHGDGAVHRDVKPANVLLGRNGGVFLVDFGAVMHPGYPQTCFDGRVGTPGFMAPEVEAMFPATTASDVWGLGASLFVMVTGRTALSLAVDHLRQDGIWAADERAPGLGELIDRTTAMDPFERWTTEEALEQFRKWVDGRWEMGDGPEDGPREGT